MPAPALKLQLLDVHGDPLDEEVDVMLRRQATGQTSVVKALAGKSTKIAGLSNDVYLVQVDPPSYLAAGGFALVKPNGGELTLKFPIDPTKVKSVVFPPFNKLSADGRRLLSDTTNLLGFVGLSGASLYDALDDIRRAGLLNILTKSAWTVLTNGKTVSSYLHRLLELRGDRFHASVPQELREEAKNGVQAGHFTEEPSGLHHPPAGFDRAGSFKSRDHYGNIQLTFFSNGTDWVADIDIDDANGLEHLFQVLRNELTNRPTHPYDIHQILIAHQMLDPGYEVRV
jgi:hypothetical protein